MKDAIGATLMTALCAAFLAGALLLATPRLEAQAAAEHTYNCMQYGASMEPGFCDDVYQMMIDPPVLKGE